jgi:hypothetical protein
MLHIDIPSLEEFKVLAQVKGETCVSLYLPTSPLGSGAKAIAPLSMTSPRKPCLS